MCFKVPTKKLNVSDERIESRRELVIGQLHGKITVILELYNA